MNNEKKYDLSEIREKIDRIDKEIVKLIEERLDIVEKVALYKKENNMKIFDRKREKEVIEKNLLNIKNDELKHYVEIVLRDIMDSSKEYQKFKIGVSEEYINDLEFDRKKLGYTGVPGAYAYEVMMNLMKNNEISNGKTADENILNFNSHKELIEAVEAGKSDFGILPIENSRSGGQYRFDK